MAFLLHFLLYSPCTISFLHIAVLCIFTFDYTSSPLNFLS
jgi:hypothetical protein